MLTPGISHEKDHWILIAATTAARRQRAVWDVRIADGHSIIEDVGKHWKYLSSLAPHHPK